MDESKYGQLSALESYGQHDQLVYDGAHDVFGNEEHHQVSFRYPPAMRQLQALIRSQIHYKTLSWQFVAVLMIAEIVSNGMLSLPSSLAAVGIVPGVIIIAFLGAFATYTSWVLIQFKIRHPEGDESETLLS